MLNNKIEIFSRMADEKAAQLTRSWQEWAAFLTTASRLYKYPYHEQLMIYAQRPDATACAEYDFWNNRMGRYVRRGSKGIALLDDVGQNPHLRYVFDVSDTGTRERSRQVKLWEYRPEHDKAIFDMLERRYNISGQDSLAERLECTAMQLCSLHPENYFQHEDFQGIFDFNTPEAVAELGTAVSTINQEVLRQIEVTIKNYEREHHAERTAQHGKQPDLHEERRLSDPRPDSERAAGETLGQVRQDAESVSEGTQTGTVQPPATEREVVSPLSGDRGDSEPPSGRNDGKSGKGSRSNRGTESQRPDEVGGTDEHLQGTGGGDPDDGAYSQLSFFLSESEQIRIIDEAENVKTSSAFSFAQSDIDQFLRYGGNTDRQRERVVAEFSKQKSTEENAAYLQSVFHGGNGITTENGSITAWYAEDGIHLSRTKSARYNHSAQVVSWESAAERVSQLLEEGSFATNVELAEAPGYETSRLAEKLWNLRHDLSEDAEKDFLLSLNENPTVGFPDKVAWLSQKLTDPVFRAKLSEEYKGFMEAYSVDRDILRFHYHRQKEIAAALADLELPRKTFETDTTKLPSAQFFITEDEIDAALFYGSGFAGGKSRIYPFFLENHTTKEKTDFLKNEYGIGGHSHALSRAAGSDEWHDGKGVAYKKTDCPNVKLTWEKVASRIADLIRKDRYLTTEERQAYEKIQSEKELAETVPDEPQTDAAELLASSQQSELTNSVIRSYNDTKAQHPDDMVLYQVGDFFEMYGEDAKAAAVELNLNLTTRTIPGAGRVEMCGFPAYMLEQMTDKLRDKHDVTISAVPEYGAERQVYSMPSIDHEAEQAIDAHEAEFGADGYRAFREQPAPTVEDQITQTLQAWNGNMDSKRAVVRYMEAHGREKDTTAWLAQEYGGDKPFIIRAGSPEEMELPWAKVQRGIAKLIQEDRFFTEQEQDNMEHIDPIVLRENLAARGIVNGEVVDPTKLDNDPFIQQVMHDTEQVAAIEAISESDIPATASDAAYAALHLIPNETVFEWNGRTFMVERVEYGAGTVSLQDMTFAQSAGFPIFRTEPISTVRRYLETQPVEQESEVVGKPNITAENFRITDTHLGEGGPKAKFIDNLRAIQLLKQLELEDRQAEPDEQEILSRYVGWGGLSDAFDPNKENWRKEYQDLKDTLTPAEYEAARASTLNAHYTSPTVIKAIYEAVGRMGFETGNILEPSCGVGNFFGMLPEQMQNSRLYGVELDPISGRIAKQLYPKADITVAGFETTDRRDFFDLAIGNVPFGQYKVNDRAYNKLNFNIHNYFFAKALDQVRPGGVVAFVTSRYTMDAKDSTVRRYLAQRAELLGAIRLPNDAFKKNAGTEVVSDIIFLQKRDRPLDIVPDWTQTTLNDDGFAVNQYFIDHPEMVLGRQESESTAHGMDYTVNPIEGLELSDQLHDAVKYIRGTYQEAELPDLGEGEAIDTSIPADPTVKNYSYTVVDGQVYYRENSRMVRPNLNATAEGRVKGMVGLRDCVHKLIDLQLDAATTDDEIHQ